MKRSTQLGFLLVVTACASTSVSKESEPVVPVYLTSDVAPSCLYKEIGQVQFANHDTSEGDDLALSIKRELGQRARRQGADAVVRADWTTKLTVVVSSNRAPSSGRQVGGPERQVTGTAIKFDNPDCKH